MEDVLGRAVSNNDLEMLHKLDLKTINEIQGVTAGKDQKAKSAGPA